MNIAQFRELHATHRISIRTHQFRNTLPSVTDPTQDIPVKNIQFMANGEPLNVKKHKMLFNNVKADNLSSLEKRNNDKFDQLGELQHLNGRVAREITEFNKRLKIEKDEK